MGGMYGFGPVVADGEVFHEAWEPPLFALTRGRGGFAGHHGRAHFRAVHRVACLPVEYLEASYYERWLWGCSGGSSSRARSSRDVGAPWLRSTAIRCPQRATRARHGVRGRRRGAAGRATAAAAALPAGRAACACGACARGAHALPALRARRDRDDRAGARRRQARRRGRARRERAGRGGVRGALPLRRPLRPARGAALPRARRPLGVLPRGG